MKSITKRLRLSSKEWELIENEMKLKNLDFSKYALSCMLSDKTPKKRKEKRLQENQAIVIELAKWGNNLNQVAKHLNANQTGLDRVGLEMLKRIEHHISEIKAQYDC